MSNRDTKMIDHGTGLRELRAWMIDRDATLRAHAFPRKERIGKLFDELLPKLTALSAAQPEGGDAAEDRFEQFVAAGIANSPEPLRELGEYLSRVLDEDKFPAADHLLLQLATSYTRPAPAQPEGGDGLDTHRAEQAVRAMPLIGPLLDAWEGLPNDIRTDDGFTNLHRHLIALNAAMEGDVVLIAARPAPAQQAVTVEMKELLHSTHEIALRGGADTHWEALAKSIAKLGIAPITARHYFADGTPREAINRHLNALSSRINAARAALASTAAKAAEGAK